MKILLSVKSISSYIEQEMTAEEAHKKYWNGRAKSVRPRTSFRLKKGKKRYTSIEFAGERQDSYILYDGESPRKQLNADDIVIVRIENKLA